MKILLFITSIYNTIENYSIDDFRKMIELLKKLKTLGNNDIVVISFCDYTENIDVLRSYIRKFKEQGFFFGEQFCGNLHYINEYGGSILYKDGKLNKVDEIIDYVKRLSKNGNEVELILCDGCMNINDYKEQMEKELSNPCFYIYPSDNNIDVNTSLNEICKYKKYTPADEKCSF